MFSFFRRKTTATTAPAPAPAPARIKRIEYRGPFGWVVWNSREVDADYRFSTWGLDKVEMSIGLGSGIGYRVILDGRIVHTGRA